MHSGNLNIIFKLICISTTHNSVVSVVGTRQNKFIYVIEKNKSKLTQ